MGGAINALTAFVGSNQTKPKYLHPAPTKNNLMAKRVGQKSALPTELPWNSSPGTGLEPVTSRLACEVALLYTNEL